MTPEPRTPAVRFAPSPTGYFHVGGARTALYNWLFARRLGGTFVLRIEDTDRARSDESWTAGIYNALDWLGLHWDEGPYRQSERRPLYDEAIVALSAGGFLYGCSCTPDEVKARAVPGAPPGYDGYCRERGLLGGEGRALRFKVPDGGSTIVHDIVRGDVEFAHSSIDDFIVVKSNGDPLFVLAVVVDDIAMEITHIIRGEEHLPTTPKAILLWRALNGPHLPVFAHLPVLVNEKRQKLSKRRDKVAVEDYRDGGILPEAMRNYLALVGWSPGDDREILSLDEMIAEFRLENVSRSPGYFDEKRLAHFNGLYLRALSSDEFAERALPFLVGDSVPWPTARFDAALFRRMAPLVQERVATLAEVPAMIEFLFDDPFIVEESASDKAIRRDALAGEILERTLAVFGTCAWEAEVLKGAIIGLGDALGRKLAKTQAPIRVATMGRSVGLPLFESLEVLGRERASERVALAIASLGDEAIVGNG